MLRLTQYCTTTLNIQAIIIVLTLSVASAVTVLYSFILVHQQTKQPYQIRNLFKKSQAYIFFLYGLIWPARKIDTMSHVNILIYLLYTHIIRTMCCKHHKYRFAKENCPVLQQNLHSNKFMTVQTAPNRKVHLSV